MKQNKKRVQEAQKAAQEAVKWETKVSQIVCKLTAIKAEFAEVEQEDLRASLVQQQLELSEAMKKASLRALYWREYTDALSVA